MARDISRDTLGAREAVGVDLGLVWLTTLSFGWWFFGNPRPLECYLDRLKVLQRALSRKRFLSGNWFTSKKRGGSLNTTIMLGILGVICSLNSVFSSYYE